MTQKIRKMKSFYIVRLTYIWILSCCLFSCEFHSGQLESIDDMMEVDPATALTELESIRKREGLDHADSAYFALLYTQAMIKCGVVVSSDSLIEIAYRKFSCEDAGNLKARTCFYKAKVAYNMGDMMVAMRDAMMAYDTAKEIDSPRWIARSAELISDIFYYVYNYVQAERYVAEAVENYHLAGMNLNHRYSLCDLATMSINEHKSEYGMRLLDSLDNIVRNEIPVDSSLLDYISTARIFGLFNTGRQDEIGSVPLLAMTDTEGEENVDLQIINSRLLYDRGDSVAAAWQLSMAHAVSDDESQLMRVRYETYRQYMDRGDFKAAAVIADTILQDQDRIAENLLKESVTSVQRDFYDGKARYQQQRSRHIICVLVLVISAIIIISALLIRIYRLRMRASRTELEVNIASLMQLRERARRVSSENDRLSQALSEQSIANENLRRNLDEKTRAEAQNTVVIEYLFREKWSTLNMLCREYFDMGDSEANRAHVINNIRKEIDKLRTERNVRNIENAVDMYMGGIMTMLRQECTFLKEEDFAFLSLVYAGFSSRAVCLFLNMKYKLFYLRKSRLSGRILDSSAPHKDLFLSRMK